MNKYVRKVGEVLPDPDRGGILMAAADVLGTKSHEPSVTLDMVTENRGRYPGYGSCGDGVTYALEGGGLRVPSLQNRISVTGEWVIGDNITRLMQWSDNTAVIRVGDPIVLSRPRGNHTGLFLGRVADLRNRGLLGPKELATPGTVFTLMRAQDLMDVLGDFADAHELFDAKPQSSEPYLTWDFNGYTAACVVTVRQEATIGRIPLSSAGVTKVGDSGPVGPYPSVSNEVPPVQAPDRGCCTRRESGRKDDFVDRAVARSETIKRNDRR